jgi:hypothetical protein
MATGISAGAWGYSPQQVAGILKSAEFGDNPLTYQLGLNSRPPSFGGNGEMISPLTVANAGYYSTGFGKRNKRNKRSSKKALSEINYLKKQLKKK